MLHKPEVLNILNQKDYWSNKANQVNVLEDVDILMTQCYICKMSGFCFYHCPYKASQLNKQLKQHSSICPCCIRLSMCVKTTSLNNNGISLAQTTQPALNLHSGNNKFFIN